MIDKPSQYERDTREMHKDFKSEVNGDLKAIWRELKEIQKALNTRLPIWATLLISILTMAVGALGSQVW